MPAGRRHHLDRLADMVLWGKKRSRHIEGMIFQIFAENEMAVDAATKCIDAIGEAANQILQDDPGIRGRHPKLELQEAYRARNRLSHGYSDIDRLRIWQTANAAVPRLVAEARQVLKQERGDDDVN